MPTERRDKVHPGSKAVLSLVSLRPWYRVTVYSMTTFVPIATSLGCSGGLASISSRFCKYLPSHMRGKSFPGLALLTNFASVNSEEGPTILVIVFRVAGARSCEALDEIEIVLCNVRYESMGVLGGFEKGRDNRATQFELSHSKLAVLSSVTPHWKGNGTKSGFTERGCSSCGVAGRRTKADKRWSSLEQHPHTILCERFCISL